MGRELVAAVIAVLAAAGGAPSAHARTVVSLEFDDARADNWDAAAQLEAHGMRGTFYVNAGRLGRPGRLDVEQLVALEGRGHEIGGHSANHLFLPDVPEDERRREICDDRVALLAAGLSVSTFAYPFSGHDPATEAMVADCGYNAARVSMDFACPGCAVAEAIPPARPFAVEARTVRAWHTADDLERRVQEAEAAGGGWVRLAFHGICENCGEGGVSPATLGAFLRWLEPRAADGTVVRTVREVIGGKVKPPVEGPRRPEPVPGENLLWNASLETDADGDAVPDCFEQEGKGDNEFAWDLVPDAHDGRSAQRLAITRYADGDRRFLVRRDLGACSAPVSRGASYTFRAWYRGTVAPFVVGYYRTPDLQWRYWTQGERLPARDTWTLGEWTSPSVPPEATGVSLGLSVREVGTLLVDDVWLGVALPPPPEVTPIVPVAGEVVRGTVRIAADVPLRAGIRGLECSVRGTPLGTQEGGPTYQWFWDSTTVEDGPAEVTLRALGGESSLPEVRVAIRVANHGDPGAPEDRAAGGCGGCAAGSGGGALGPLFVLFLLGARRARGVAVLGAVLAVATLGGCAEPCRDGSCGSGPRAPVTGYAWNRCAPDCEGKLGHAPGLEILYGELDQGTLESADLILEDRWPVPRHDPVHLPSPLTWTEDPFHEEYWRFDFYSLRPTTHLLAAFLATGDLRYRDKLLEVIESFASLGWRSPYGRDTHGAAWRAMVLANTYWKLRMADALPAEVEPTLFRLVESHGAFLEDPATFDEHYNHGFAQAGALILLGANFPASSHAAAWRELGRERLGLLLDAAVDADGVANEQSTYYHFYILTQLWQISRWSAAFAVASPERLEPVIARMIRFGTYVIQPNGFIPLFGASLARDMRRYEPELYAEMGARIPEFAYVLSAGREGREPEGRLALFPLSGQAILRSGFGPPEEFEAQTYVHFDVGPYRTDHSDLDALAITLYAAGRTLLPDSGLFTYDEESEERAYFHGTRAHNTVVVDRADQVEGSPRVVHEEEGDGWAYLSAAHDLYPGVTHRRGVLLLGRDLVLLIDDLAGTRDHLYDQTFHLAPDLGVRGADASRATAVDALDQPVLEIRQALAGNLEVDTCRGGRSPLDGWYSEKYGVSEPAYVLRFRADAREARFVTLLASGEYAGRPAEVTAREVDGTLDIEVCTDRTGFDVAIESPGGPGERVRVAPDPCTASD